MAWHIKRHGRFFRRWEYQAASSAHGLVYGYALTKRGARRKLVRAEIWLYNQ